MANDTTTPPTTDQQQPGFIPTCVGNTAFLTLNNGSSLLARGKRLSSTLHGFIPTCAGKSVGI